MSSLWQLSPTHSGRLRRCTRCGTEPGPLVSIFGRRVSSAMSMEQNARQNWGALLLRLLLGAFFIAHLYWKVCHIARRFERLAGRPGQRCGYPPFVPLYVLTAEFMGALLLIPGILTRYVALYALPMMLGAAHFWLARNGFYFTKAGAELPLVWTALLCIQAVLGDGSFALVRSPSLNDVFAWMGTSRMSTRPRNRLDVGGSSVCFPPTPAIGPKSAFDPFMPLSFRKVLHVHLVASAWRWLLDGANR